MSGAVTVVVNMVHNKKNHGSILNINLSQLKYLM